MHTVSKNVRSTEVSKRLKYLMDGIDNIINTPQKDLLIDNKKRVAQRISNSRNSSGYLLEQLL